MFSKICFVKETERTWSWGGVIWEELGEKKEYDQTILHSISLNILKGEKLKILKEKKVMR